jgi:hypothetical protein
MSGQFQVDVDELNKFASHILGGQGQTGLISLIQNDSHLQSQLSSLVATQGSPSGQQLYWGQDLFKDAWDLCNADNQYRVQYGQMFDGLNKFLGALQTLGELAKAVAQNYQNASTYESVNGQTIADDLNNIPPSQTQFFGGSGG